MSTEATLLTDEQLAYEATCLTKLRKYVEDCYGNPAHIRYIEQALASISYRDTTIASLTQQLADLRAKPAEPTIADKLNATNKSSMEIAGALNCAFANELADDAELVKIRSQLSDALSILDPGPNPEDWGNYASDVRRSIREAITYLSRLTQQSAGEERAICDQLIADAISGEPAPVTQADRDALLGYEQPSAGVDADGLRERVSKWANSAEGQAALSETVSLVKIAIAEFADTSKITPEMLLQVYSARAAQPARQPVTREEMFAAFNAAEKLWMQDVQSDKTQWEYYYDAIQSLLKGRV